MARVLVVDDDELVRRTVKMALQRAKHEVIEAADGERALALLEKSGGDVDLVVTDLIMPEIDGIGLILALRKKFPNIRAIAISGGARVNAEDFLRMSRSLGARMTLAKPFTPEQLLKAVDEVLMMPS